MRAFTALHGCICGLQVPDYDESIIQQAVKILADKQLGEYEHRRRLEALVAGEAPIVKGGAVKSGESIGSCQ